MGPLKELNCLTVKGRAVVVHRNAKAFHVAWMSPISEGLNPGHMPISCRFMCSDRTVERNPCGSLASSQFCDKNVLTECRFLTELQVPNLGARLHFAVNRKTRSPGKRQEITVPSDSAFTQREENTPPTCGQRSHLGGITLGTAVSYNCQL